MAAPPCVLPTVGSTNKLLGSLLGDEATIKEAPTPFASAPAALGTYVSDEGELAALIVCDLEFACHIGAVLAMIPADIAKQSIQNGEIAADLLENLREVLNIAARLFNYASKSLHVSLADVIVTGVPVPKNVIEMYKAPARRLDLEVDVPGYGSGNFVLLVG